MCLLWKTQPNTSNDCAGTNSHLAIPPNGVVLAHGLPDAQLTEYTGSFSGIIGGQHCFTQDTDSTALFLADYTETSSQGHQRLGLAM